MQNWTVCNKSGDFAGIMDRFGLSSVAARLLVNRDIVGEKAIRDYLYPDESLLYSPKQMYNLSKAADIICKKLEAGVKLRVIGDYDADGIMATYILTDALARLGADVDFYIPDRVKDGYGINSEMISVAGNDGVDTIITCDNGIAATAAAAEAGKRGITLVVTDHHELPDVLPDADVIVDPKQPEETYPCRNICGAVVAAKLAEELLNRCRGYKAGRSVEYIEFMAIATICDVVPLTDENRVIAKLGIKKLNEVYMEYIRNVPDNTAFINLSGNKLLSSGTEAGSVNIGLLALLFICDIKGRVVSDYTIGFQVGPCFNATGRLDLAAKSLHLLKCGTPDEAYRYAEICRSLNDERKAMTAEYAQKAYDIVENSLLSDRVLIVELPECHESLAGIIAGRIRERYCRPTIVLTNANEGMKGSGRSIPEYNMFEELKSCSELFTKFGGHPMAAGISLPTENVPLLREKLNERCMLTETDMSEKIVLDAAAGFNMFGEREVNEIELFAPFGTGNAPVLFGEKNLQILRLSNMGKDGAYLRMDVMNSFGCRYQIPYFKDKNELLLRFEEKYGKAEVDAAFAGATNSLRITVAYVPKINSYKGVNSVQMNVRYVKV